MTLLRKKCCRNPELPKSKTGIRNLKAGLTYLVDNGICPEDDTWSGTYP